ncbi:MAG: serpin family protein [Anaerolineales bacterium]|nr:serpin family protein [Anaerolineales bacterium]
MKKHLQMVFALATAASLLLSACGPSGGEVAQSKLKRVTDPEVAPSDLTELSAGNNAFAFDMYQAVRPADGNLFYSPYSISLALAMTYAGARGETAIQMAETLHYTLPADHLHPAFNALDLDLAQRPEQASGVSEKQRFELNIVNSLWGQKDWPFLPGFLDTLALNYGAGMRLVDYQTTPEPARKAINDWVSDETKGRIEDLIPSGVIDRLTRLVLVNAIYFKASWDYPFEESLTEDGQFKLLDGSQVSVPLMSLDTPERLGYVDGEGFQAVSLPYKGGLAEMVILLPDEGQFEAFEAALTAERFAGILSGIKTQSVNLTMPKFSFTRDLSLNEVLAGMGMSDAFDPDRADFSGIDGSRDLYIQAALHKAFIAVDEAGTEAAAATTIIIGLTSMPISEINIRIDRPFIFLIRDISTGSILFLGRVVNPDSDGE